MWDRGHSQSGPGQGPGAMMDGYRNINGAIPSGPSYTGKTCNKYCLNACKKKDLIKKIYWKVRFIIKTRSTNVVWNTGCARSRYILHLLFIFLNQWMNESINELTEYI